MHCEKIGNQLIYESSGSVPHQYWHPVVVQRWGSILHCSDFSREEEEREDTCVDERFSLFFSSTHLKLITCVLGFLKCFPTNNSNNEELSQKQQEVGDLI